MQGKIFQDYWRKPSFPHEIFYIKPWEKVIGTDDKIRKYYMLSIPIRYPDLDFLTQIYSPEEKLFHKARDKVREMIKENPSEGLRQVVVDMRAREKEWCWNWAYPVLVIEGERKELIKYNGFYDKRFLKNINGIFLKYRNDVSLKEIFKSGPSSFSKRSLKELYSNYPKFLVTVGEVLGEKENAENWFYPPVPINNKYISFRLGLSMALGLVPTI